MNSQFSQESSLHNNKRSRKVCQCHICSLNHAVSLGLPRFLFLEDLYKLEKLESLTYSQLGKIDISGLGVSSQVNNFISLLKKIYYDIVLNSFSDLKTIAFFRNGMFAVDQHISNGAEDLETYGKLPYSRVYNGGTRYILPKVFGLIKCLMMHLSVKGDSSGNLSGGYKIIHKINHLYYQDVLPLLAVYKEDDSQNTAHNTTMCDALMRIEMAFHENFFTKGVDYRSVFGILENLVLI